MSALPVFLRLAGTPERTASSPPARSGGAQPSSPARLTGDRIAAAPSTPRGRSALLSELLARVPPADRSAAETAIPAILDAARSNGSTDPNRVGYLLATAQTESDFGAQMTETGHSQAWFNSAYGCEDGNRPGTGDGFRYRGRGYVQTTHAGRYAQLSRSLGLPDVPVHDHGRPAMEPALVAHPERLAQPKLAALALVVGVQKNLFTRNPAAALERTIPIGRKPGDVDFYHARGIVNGIVDDQARTVAARATVYAQILAAFRHAVPGAPSANE
jgi:predicted chitinase